MVIGLVNSEVTRQGRSLSLEYHGNLSFLWSGLPFAATRMN